MGELIGHNELSEAQIHEGDMRLEMMGISQIRLMPMMNKPERPVRDFMDEDICGPHVRPLFDKLDKIPQNHPKREEFLNALREVALGYAGLTMKDIQPAQNE